MLKRSGLIVFYCCAAVQLSAQQNTLSTGGNAVGAGGTVSYSVGQIDYINTSTTGGISTEGVQQPIEIYSLETLESTTASNISVFPNPATNTVTLNFVGKLTESTYFELFSADAKCIKTDVITQPETLISFHDLTPGIYFLKISESGLIYQTFKIIKN